MSDDDASNPPHFGRNVSLAERTFQTSSSIVKAVTYVGLLTRRDFAYAAALRETV